MKIFPDTNVLISAFTARGLCADLWRTMLAQHEIILGEVVINEVSKTLSDRFLIPAKQLSQIIAFLNEFPIIAKPTRVRKIDIRDPSDAWILTSALQAEVEVLVTGDKDLLVLSKTIKELAILTPRELWDWLRVPPSS